VVTTEYPNAASLMQMASQTAHAAGNERYAMLVLCHALSSDDYWATVDRVTRNTQAYRRRPRGYFNVVPAKAGTVSGLNAAGSRPEPRTAFVERREFILPFLQ
jgi:hypothetical protein